ncbi:MAG: leucine-rich repeat domain-containing protein, partial [Oscillospiraceae bacterium]|nr:leucine-rich repeat domain-containing protein [Oscillospiraceae bacterium]
IHVVGDWVYYASRGASLIDGEIINSIRKIRTDGTEETSLTGNMLGYYDEIYSMSVVGDWIYYELYTPVPGQKPFARIRTDGTGFMQIYENIYGDAPQINEDYVTIGGVDYPTDLTLLDLYDQGLTDEDIEPLRHMTNLTNLHLSMNSITDISVLSHLTKLEILSIQSNQIADISVVKEMPSLTVFFAGYNEITDISVLEGLHSLSTLSLGDNKISDISALKGLNLWLLDLCNNPIDDLSPLYEVSVSDNLSLVGIDVQGFIFPDGLENLILCAEYLTPANLEQLNELDVTWLTLYDCHRNAIFRRIIEDALPNRTHHTQEEDFIPNQTLIWFIE